MPEAPGPRLPPPSEPDRTSPVGLLRQASLDAKGPAQREAMVLVFMIFLVGLIVLLSIDFRGNPPTVNPMVLLFGILVVGILAVVRRWGRYAIRFCPACGRGIPSYSVFCPICGQRLP